MIGYFGSFNASGMTMLFEASDKKLLKHYIKISGKKISSLIKVKFDSETVYEDKCMKTKIRPYGGIINTKFHDGKKNPHQKMHHTTVLH